MTFDNKKLDFALSFCQKGFTIIPADETKRPLIEWEEWKGEDKIPDETQVLKWNEQFNNPNWAVITKKQIIVLDFEKYQDATTFFKNFEELKQQTLIVKTAHGGIHFYALNKGNEIGRHTKIFGYKHEVDLLNGKGYALLPYSEIDHSKCDAKKPCDHKSKTIYEIISTTTEIMEINHNNNFIQDIFQRAIALEWITPEYAKEKIKELTQELNQSENEKEENKNLHLSDQAIELIIEGICAKNKKFEEIYTTGNYEKYGYASSSEAEEYLITILISLGIDNETINKVIKKSKTRHIHKYKKESDQDKYIKHSIKKGKSFFERLQNEQKKEEDEEKKITFYSKFRYNEKYYNEIKTDKGYQFIVFDNNGNIEGVIPELTIPDNDKDYRVLPAPQITERKIDSILNNDEKSDSELIKFPGYPIEFTKPYDLFLEIKQFIHKYVELKPLDETLLAIYVLQASIFDLEKKFTFPLVHILGPYGRGKTRNLTVLYYLIPYSIFTDDIKSAAIKRVSQLYNPVLLVDEKGQMDQDLRAILNARYNKNAVILNASKEIQTGYSGIIAYRIPGPMVLAGREVFHDPAIESKSFQINMNFELTREDIPRELKGEIFEEFIKESEILRAKLMFFRIKYFNQINEKLNTEPTWLREYEQITEPRLYELLSSLSDILNVIPELENEITQIIDEQIRQNVLVAQETPEGIVAKTLIELIKDDINGKEYDKDEYEIEPIKKYTFNGKEYTGIYLKAIYSQVGENYSSMVSKLLGMLGMKIDRPRVEITYIKNGEEHRKTKKYSFVRIPPLNLLLSLFKRYDIDYINMMIELRKIGITEVGRKINFEEVKKKLDRLDSLVRWKQIQINVYELNKLINYINSKLYFDIPLEAVQPVQAVQEYIEDRIKTLENTESVKENKETKGALDQFNQDGKISLESQRLTIENPKDLKYFRASEYYGNEFFEDMGIKLIDYFKLDKEHYYALEITDIKNERAYKFSSRFSIKAEPVSEEEFKQKGKEALKNDP